MNGEGMTALSWCYMLATWTIIIGLMAYCFYRVFTKKH